MSTVRFENINKFYGETQILDSINLDVKEGEFLVLVGPSGCGKSTTLRMVAGLEEPTTGGIFIDDHNVSAVEPSKRNVAMVFQNYALYPHMDVFENMAFGLKIRKFNSSDIHKRVKEAAEILQIHDLLHRRPKELSGGQRQRVALGRCIVRNPKVFLFDEPLSNLDAKLRAGMRVEIKKLHQILKTTMIYVTHDQTEAMTMGDRIAVMNGGVIEQIDSPLAIYQHPVNRFVAGFIGSPQMNFLSGQISVQANRQVFTCERLKIDFSDITNFQNGQRLTIGVRPEDAGIINTEESQDFSFDAQVELIEPLGSIFLIYLTSYGIKFTCSSALSDNIKAGKMVRVGIHPDKVHFFDLNEKSISPN